MFRFFSRLRSVNVTRETRSNTSAEAAVLLVEHSHEDARTIRRVMRKGGIAHRMKHVASIEAARRCLFPSGRRAAPEAPPKLILLDATLAGLQADGFLSQLRGAPALRDIPIILLTPGPTGHALPGSTTPRADVCLAKPFQLRELTDAVLELCHLRTHRALTGAHHNGL